MEKHDFTSKNVINWEGLLPYRLEILGWWVYQIQIKFENMFTVSTQYTIVTNGQTDRRTDRHRTTAIVALVA